MNDRRDFGMGSGPTAPVNVGEEMDVTIEAVGEKGDGIAKKSGFVLFVPNTKEGQTVRIKITKVLRRVGFAEVVGQASGSSAAEAPVAEPTPEDSEDFGEEPAEEPAAEPVDEPEAEPEEKLAEEPTEEPEAEPAEEPTEPEEKKE